MSRSAPHGSWSSPITADALVAGVKGLSALSSNSSSLFWLESRPEEAGRVTLVQYDGAGARELTRTQNVRTRVHEYGGGAYCVTNTHAYFVDLARQDIHEVTLKDASCRSVTNTGAARRYADLVVDAVRNALYCVCEQHGTGEAKNFLVAIDIATGAERVLHEGHDFYSSPRMSPDGTHLSFVTWDHPNMPWDGTQLHVACLDADGTFRDDAVVAGGVAEAIVEPRWIDAHRLVFASDRTGWWNLYCYDDSGIWCVHEDAAEYTQPPWGFAGRHYVAVDADHLVCCRVDAGQQSLWVLSTRQELKSPVASEWSAFDSLTVHQGRVCFVGRHGSRMPSIVAKDLATGEEHVLAEAGALPFDPALFQPAESIVFPTRDGATAHAFFYAPCNPGFSGPEGRRPPLLVTTHGGPTGAADSALNLRIRYYTSRGWAVLDVNYGGSSGFGRDYRERLAGKWGIVDVDDCVAAVDYVAAAGRVDGERVAIRGGSAGGFTTLAALTFTSRFRAGASHYGIGDLEQLARDTHKFESRYLDSLVGPYPQQRATYVERSPINHVDRLACPVIFFQGLEDRVVPPNQAEAMVAALRAKGIPVAYLPFAGEQHGFRAAANIKRAVEAEYFFFSRVFGITPADRLPDVEIENL